MRCVFHMAADGTLKFRFTRDGSPLRIGSQTFWITWDDFRAAYDRQLGLFSEPVPDLDEFYACFADAMMGRPAAMPVRCG